MLLMVLGFGSIVLIIKHYYDQTEGRLFDQESPKANKDRPWLSNRSEILNRLRFVITFRISSLSHFISRRPSKNGSERYLRDSMGHSHTDSIGRFDI